MTFPNLLCAAACAAAALAALAGHLLGPSMRARRARARAVQQRHREVTAARQWVAGRFAVHDGEALFYRFLADHRELWPDADRADA